MASVAQNEIATNRSSGTGWLPLATLPVAVSLLAAGWPPWILMWMLAVSIFVGLKWPTFADCNTTDETTFARSLAYLFCWPGMDAESFISEY